MRGIVTTLLEIGGVALVVGGVAFYSIPVALVVAGVAVLLACWRLS